MCFHWSYSLVLETETPNGFLSIVDYNGFLFSLKIQGNIHPNSSEINSVIDSLFILAEACHFPLSLVALMSLKLHNLNKKVEKKRWQKFS